MLMLKLFHGRDDPAEVMDDWGYDGPIFGPTPYVHGTYNANLKFNVGDQDCILWFADDMVVYKGKYYGDWSAFDESLLTDEERLNRVEEFEDERGSSTVIDLTPKED